MALHDSEPNTPGRLNPKPQAPDGLTERRAEDTVGITNKQGGSSGATVSTKGARVTVNDGSNDRVAIGLLSDGSYGMKVSQEGYDVGTATDTQLVMSSAFNNFKIIQSGTATLTKSASDDFNSISIPHGLSFVPNVMAFGGFRGGSYSEYYSILPISSARTTGADSGKILYEMDVTVDDTNIIFAISTPDFASNTFYTSALTISFRYYLLQETLSV